MLSAEQTGSPHRPIGMQSGLEAQTDMSLCSNAGPLCRQFLQLREARLHLRPAATAHQYKARLRVCECWTYTSSSLRSNASFSCCSASRFSASSLVLDIQRTASRLISSPAYRNGMNVLTRRIRPGRRTAGSSSGTSTATGGGTP